ncbi:uncharacterized protein LOC129340345 [Eublepharis macularius]|uniref:Uncharacterized protein LOC129340345 n=1 Tax=Eublepharis macularius TaxID=481883 RepID=A0AA97K6W4_EUBMA|nr:uncharacterized protein LOC129340345 [Eublepharis macularius]
MEHFPSRSQYALKVVRLQSPFLKVEDESRQLRPLLQQFKNFPELYFLALRRHSPFDPPRSPAITEAPGGQPVHSDPSSDYCRVPKRQRGYCECCEEAFAELQTHLQSPRHTAFSLDASHYALVDNLISQMTNDFAVPSWLSPTLRVPPPAYGDLFGFQEDILERADASGQPERYCVSSEGSVAQPVSTGSSPHLLEDQSSFQQIKLPQETLSTAAPLTSQSLQSPSGWAGGSSCAEHHGRGGGIEDAPLKTAASPDVGYWPTSQQKQLWTPPTILPLPPRKRKLSYSPRGQAKKRPAVTTKSPSQLLPDTNTVHRIPVVGATELSFSHECSTQTNPGHLQLPAVPVVNPQRLHAPTQFPQEGSSWLPQECSVKDTGCLNGPVQQLEHKEGPAVCPSEEQHAWTPCKFLSMDAEMSMSGFPVGKSMPSQLLGSEVQPCSRGIAPSEFVQVVERLGPGQPPLSCSEESSSSESEWDRPLLCALEGASRLPFERPIDSALLGTCISMRDSGYESHLSSVLWQTLEQHEACKRDSNGSHSHMEVAPTPFGACLDRLGPFLEMNIPSPRLSWLPPPLK